MINSPAKLVAEMINLFPAFEDKWDGGEAFGYEGGNYGYHAVMLTFGPMSRQLFAQASSEQLLKFCSLINVAIAQGGELENAFSTCFLEHASQIGVRTVLRPYLSGQAKRALR
ncbi:MAG: hypothetical protein WAT67_13295 [Candidatus Contendobacter sp.]